MIRAVDSSRLGIARRLLTRLLRQPAGLVLVALTGLIASAATLMGPWLIGSVIDQLIGPGGVVFEGLGRRLGLLALSYALAAAFGWLLVILAQAQAQRLAAGLRRSVFSHLTRLPLAYLDRQGRGDLISRLTNDCDAIGEGVSQLLAQLFTGLVILIGSLVLMLRMSPGITLLMLLLMPLNLLITRFIATRSHDRFREQARVTGQVNALGEELIQQRRLLQASNACTEADGRFDEANGRLYVEGQKAQFYSSLTNPGTRFVNNVAYAVVGLAAALTRLAAGSRSDR